jgi:hypothetical protein
VNAIVDRLVSLADVVPVRILMGNHDGSTADRPFWAFLDQLQNIDYYTKLTPSTLRHRVANALMVPYGQENELVRYLDAHDFIPFTVVFMHATVNGARSENGTKLETPLRSRFLPSGFKGKVWSGDVHVPQIIGDVEYIGCPYHIRYGDSFEPRTVIYDVAVNRIAATLRYEDAPRLLTVKVPFGEELDWSQFAEHDRVKLSAEIDCDVLPQDWQAYVARVRGDFAARGVELSGASLDRKFTGTTEPQRMFATLCDEDIVRRFATGQNYDDDTCNTGLDIVKGK